MSLTLVPGHSQPLAWTTAKFQGRVLARARPLRAQNRRTQRPGYTGTAAGGRLFSEAADKIWTQGSVRK